MKLEAAIHRAHIDDLADQIALCAARIDAALHELLTHIRRFEELRGWAKQGAKSCAHWLSWRIGLGMVAAREKVRVSVALGRLPRVDAALSRGELSYAKVRAITRVATPANEDLLLDQARGTTGAELEKICSKVRALAPGAALDEERRFVRRRSLSDGLVQIELRLLPDEAERVWQALAEARRRVGGQGADSAESADGGAPRQEANDSAESAWSRRSRTSRARCSILGGGAGRSPLRSLGRCAREIGAAPSPAATAPRSSMRTTSSRGRSGARRRWRTSSWCATRTTSRCTRAASRRRVSTGKSCSAIQRVR
ncbi:MAG: DUF222 domain-containing protein [Polyangiaceae bacterium]|jgi:hypothetical protein|nr:DUF222 domain-containing protein [Polyangiaceae bacterium]